MKYYAKMYEKEQTITCVVVNDVYIKPQQAINQSCAAVSE